MKIKLNSKSKYRAIVSFFVLALAAHYSHAAGGQSEPSGKNKSQEPLTITLSAQKVQISGGGKETLTRADKVKPGDLVQYSAVYRNQSKKSINGLNASLPIPLGMEYVGKSSHPASVMVTADGVKFEAEPLMRTVKDQTGKEQKVAVPYSDYRSLRWPVGTLEAGKKVEVRARMRVIELPKSPEELVAKPASQPAKPEERK